MSRTGTALHRLVYCSTIDFDATSAPYTHEIWEILNWSRAYNPTAQVTGALMVSATHFAQVLEGPLDSLRPLFGNIACDTRHRLVTHLQCEPAIDRHFGDWSMAYVSEEWGVDVPLSVRRPELSLFAASVSADRVLALLRYLVQGPQGGHGGPPSD